MEKEENILSQHSDNDTDEKDATIAESRDDTSEKLEAGSDSPQHDAPNDNAPATIPNPEEWEYVTGFKLLVAIAAVTAAIFIMLLDTSIVATVCEFFEIELLSY
jgi:hypothetical protein